MFINTRMLIADEISRLKVKEVKLTNQYNKTKSEDTRKHLLKEILAYGRYQDELGLALNLLVKFSGGA